MLCAFNKPSSHWEAFEDLARRRYQNNPFHLAARCEELKPDHHRYFLQSDDDGGAVVRCVAIIGSRQQAGPRLGMLGLFDAAEDVERGQILEMFEAACRYLKEAGCETVIGPINGSTWFDYRLSVAGGGRPFFSDVQTPDEYLGHWLLAGFKPVEHYSSTVFERYEAPSSDRFCRRLKARGVFLEPVGAQNFSDVLPEIHRLCVDAFKSNPFFQPATFEVFQTLYAPLERIIDPDWALIARAEDGSALGFALAFPDFLDEKHKSLVVKTVAARQDGSANGQDGSANGVGVWLTNLLHQRANAQGFDRVYHALMHEANASTRIHARTSRSYRHYVLLGRTL
jgi:hypothetical protein